MSCWVNQSSFFGGSELLENQQNDLVFFKIIPFQKPQKLTASKIKFEKFGPKIIIHD